MIPAAPLPPATPAASGRPHGFTLLEVLVALAIIAIALAAIVGETVQRLGNAARLTDRTLAHWVAMNRVTEQQLRTDWPTAGVTTGTVDLAGREWYWSIKVSNTEDANVRRLDVEVRANKEEEQPRSSVIAYLEHPS
jgi:general secretion pathway protein I